MTAFTNMFHKMHLIRSACGRHDSKTFASHAARASQGIIPRHSPSVDHPSALRDPSAASASSGRNGPLACLESRYQAFIASRNRITLVCLELRLVQSPHATTIIIAFVDIPHRPHTALGGYECVLASVLMDNLNVAYAAAI